MPDSKSRPTKDVSKPVPEKAISSFGNMRSNPASATEKLENFGGEKFFNETSMIPILVK